jgi:hypothetical protein
MIVSSTTKGEQLMPPHKCAHYNTEFAKAVIKAFLAGRRKFTWHKTCYDTVEHICRVREDLAQGWYKVDIDVK